MTPMHAESKYLEFCTVPVSSSLATGHVDHTRQNVIIIIIIINSIFINVLSQHPDCQ